MVKLSGYNSQVRIATSEGGLATAPVITNIQSIEWDIDQSIDEQSKGLGQGRWQDITEGLISVSGSIKRWYDTVQVVPSPGTTTFASMVEAYQGGALAELYIQATDTDTDEVFTLKRVKGKYNTSRPVDGYKEETYDFKAGEVTKT